MPSVISRPSSNKFNTAYSPLRHFRFVPKTKRDPRRSPTPITLRWRDRFCCSNRAPSIRWAKAFIEGNFGFQLAVGRKSKFSSIKSLYIPRCTSSLFLFRTKIDRKSCLSGSQFFTAEDSLSLWILFIALTRPDFTPSETLTPSTSRKVAVVPVEVGIFTSLSVPNWSFSGNPVVVELQEHVRLLACRALEGRNCGGSCESEEAFHFELTPLTATTAGIALCSWSFGIYSSFRHFFPPGWLVANVFKLLEIMW